MHSRNSVNRLFALSHSPNADFDPTTPFIEEITQKVINHGLPDGICLNVNFPAKCTPLGLKVVRAAKSHWTEEYATYATHTARLSTG